MSIPRDKLLEVKSKETEDILPFISTHNPKNKEVFGIIKNNMEPRKTSILGELRNAGKLGEPRKTG